MLISAFPQRIPAHRCSPDNDFGMAVVQSGAGKTETVLDFVCDVRLLQNTQDSYVLRAFSAFPQRIPAHRCSPDIDFGMAVDESGAGNTETVLDFVYDVRLLQNTQDSYVLRAFSAFPQRIPAQIQCPPMNFGMAVVQSGAGNTETVLDFVCDVRLLQNTQDSYVLRAFSAFPQRIPAHYDALRQ